MKKNPKNKKLKPLKSILATKKRGSSRKYSKTSRSIHKKIALHPLNILFMLCLGVLLAMSTLYAAADSYTVSAVVPKPPGPSSPAAISSPVDGQHFSTRVITITGSCPADPYVGVYVALFTNHAWTGYVGCTNNTFTLTTILYPGVNSLQVRVFDDYNTPGPLLPLIHVVYDVPVSVKSDLSPAVVAPDSIQVIQVDNNTPYVSKVAQDVSNEPTITGIAPPLSHIHLIIHSDPVYCDTTADSQGFWSCKVSRPLPLGVHTVYVQATTILGKVINFQTFQIVSTTNEAIPPFSNSTFHLTTNFQYIKYQIDQTVTFSIFASGGVAPYAFSLNWGDGSRSVVTRLISGPFDISHVYTKTNSLLENKSISIEGIDSQGDASSLQLFAPINNPAYKNLVAYVSQSTGLWTVFSSVKSWLWIIWPGYIIILLMILSFWLGEKEELIKLIKRRQRKHKLAYKR